MRRRAFAHFDQPAERGEITLRLACDAPIIAGDDWG
jgi:hypothetical protein